MIKKDNQSYLLMMCMSYLFLFCFSLLYIIFFINNTQILQTTTYDTFNIFLKVLLPSIIPMYIMSNILINNKITQTLLSKLKPLFKVFDSTYSISLFVSSIFLGNPTSIINIISSYKKNKISYDDTMILLKSCSFINPLFIINFCKENKLMELSYYIIFINIFTNYLLLIIHKHKNTKNVTNFDKCDIFKLLNNSTLILFNVFIIFYFINIIKSLIYTIDLNIYLKIIFDFLEVTSGINNLIKYPISLNIKKILISLLISSCGLCIILQSLNEIKKVPNNRHFINQYLIGRFYQILINTLLFLIFLH